MKNAVSKYSPGPSSSKIVAQMVVRCSRAFSRIAVIVCPLSGSAQSM